MRTNISWCALFLLFLVVACRKDKIPTLQASPELKKMLPYHNGQIVRYASTQGRVVEAVVTAKTGVIKKSACANCDAYIYEEYMECVFTAINVSRPFVHMSVDNRPTVFMTIHSPEDNYQVGGGFDFTTIEGTSQPSCTAPRQTCLDSLVLNGKTYSKVLEVISGANGSTQLTKAYYTVNKGLLGFTYGNGNTYLLVE